MLRMETNYWILLASSKLWPIFFEFSFEPDVAGVHPAVVGRIMSMKKGAR
jgi:hypothetical protein